MRVAAAAPPPRRGRARRVVIGPAGMLVIAALLPACAAPQASPAPVASFSPGPTSAAPSEAARVSPSPSSTAGSPATPAGTWQRLDDMSTARWSFSAVELGDGRVLVVDSEPCNAISRLTGPPQPPARADILDPATGRWTKVPAFGATRLAFAMVALRDGRALIAGGDNGWWGAYSSTKLFDPSTSSWSAGRQMGSARDAPVAARLPDGRVLVAGGTYSAGVRDEADFYAREADGTLPDDVELLSAELYDPATGGWTATGNLRAGVTGGQAFTRPDGRILVVAPRGDQPALAQLYDPAAGSWATAGTLDLPRDSALVMLGDGSLLVIGGTDAEDRSVATVRRFDPLAGRSVEVAQLLAPRSLSVAARLADGRVLLAGGSLFDGTGWRGKAAAQSDAFIYDPGADRWIVTAPMPFADRPGQALTLADGTVLVMGGSVPFEGDVMDACEPIAVGWTALFRADASG